MPTILRLVKTAYETAYDLNSYKKQYSEPKIEDCGGDLSQRWYVYYSFRNPDTGKLQRQTPIYTGLSQHKTITDRRAAAEVLRKTVKNILEGGFNPYVENETDEERLEKMTVSDALDYALRIGKNTWSETSYPDLKSRVTQFKVWLNNNGHKERYITAVTKKTVIRYLNTILERSSASNRNNTKNTLSAAFGILTDNEIIPANFIKDIKQLKSTPERHRSYTTTQENDLYNYLLENDPLLLLYVKFVCYNFLRPVEVNRLRVKDLDLKDKTIIFKEKNKPIKTKYLPSILYKELYNLPLGEPDDFIFTPTGVGKWDANDRSRRDHFSKRFKLVKDKFGLDEEYGIYSFRHTFITKLYNALIKKLTPDDAMSHLMTITGHATQAALKKYLRKTDSFKPKDWSEYFEK
ncbi:tyrosine-type recombinase/integrase [Flavobacterium sp. AG291]|uniref:tyrosine-type recombinase/integrase n=1 Tax=Flavobacterium sp. AG291 TaxID=2184000 RepID=UPI000E0B7671|nr:tyrosine-type recombinase/integrase [Flavobacterium sp. AG291]RDI07027.1 phage integrase family protein [Flavobacterium sp. AG291]